MQSGANLVARKVMRTSVWPFVCYELPSALHLGLRAKGAAAAGTVEGERVAARANVARYHDRFKDEVEFRRSRAKRAREAANVAPMPSTRCEWAHKISKREDRLRARMGLATATRRKLIARLHAANGVPEHARRLQPGLRGRGRRSRDIGC